MSALSLCPNAATLQKYIKEASYRALSGGVSFHVDA